MASSCPGKRTFGTDTDHDIVSHLPWEIKDKIISKLPLKDAVRTSILSTNWRYAWTSIPEIVVNDDDLVPDVNIPGASVRFVKIVDALLFDHMGPILKFYLSTKYRCPEAFDRWILNLSRNGITHITFALNSAYYFVYWIPSDFFFCDALQSVDLSKCFMALPRGFEGFKHLRSLKLNKCSISAADLNWLISSSPNLVELYLRFYQIMDDVKIVSSRLALLAVLGDFSFVQIDAPNLTHLFIGCSMYETSSARVKCINNFCHNLGGLLKIRHIGFIGCSVLYLVDRSPPVLRDLCFKSLREIHLGVDLADQKQSSFTFSLLQNATNLKYLRLYVRAQALLQNTTHSNLWDRTIVFKALRKVIIERFKSSEPVLAFAKFILSSTPNLRKLTLMEDPTAPKEDNLEAFERLLEFKKASTRAQIILER